MTRIQIRQTPGAIQIESQPAKLKILRSQRLALSMRQKRAEMNIERRPSRLLIDQTECFASSGLKTPLRLAGDFYRNSLSAGLETISSIVEEGLRFLRIEQGGHPFRDIARTRGVYPKQITVRAMPSEGPRIRFEPGELHVSWTPHSVDASWDVRDRETEYIPHRVSIRMNPYPSIEISTAEEEKAPLPQQKLDSESVHESGRAHP